MSADVLEKLIQDIIKKTGLKRDEIFERFRRKKEEVREPLSDLMIMEMVAKDLEEEAKRVNIADLIPNMGGVNIVARIERIYEPEERRRNDRVVRLIRMIIADKTGKVVATLWDDEKGERIKMVEEGKLKKGEAIEIKDAYIKERPDHSPEVVVNLRSSISVLPPTSPKVKDLPPPPETVVRIRELRPEMGIVDVIGRVVYAGSVKTFVDNRGDTRKVGSFFITDGTGQVKVVVWGRKADVVEGLRRGETVLVENAEVKERGGTLELHVELGRLVLSPSVDIELPDLGPHIKIRELESGMEPEIVARVMGVFGPFDFRRLDGSTGKVSILLLADETGYTRATVWGDAASEVVGKVKEGDVVKIRGKAKLNQQTEKVELSVESPGQIEVNPEGAEVKVEAKRLRIAELEPDEEFLEIVGRVLEKSEPKMVKGRWMASMVIGDDTGCVRVSLWDQHSHLVTMLKPGQVVKLRNAYTTTYGGVLEVRVGRFGEIQIDPPGEQLAPLEAIREAFYEPQEMKIEELRNGTRAKIRGTVVEVKRRRPLFEICPECGVSLGTFDHTPLCQVCNKQVVPSFRALLDLMIDDGTGVIRAVFFGKAAEEAIGLSVDEISRRLSGGLMEFYDGLNLVGKELVLIGVAREDKMSPEQLEFRVEKVETANFRELAEKMLREVKMLGGG